MFFVRPTMLKKKCIYNPCKNRPISCLLQQSLTRLRSIHHPCEGWGCLTNFSAALVSVITSSSRDLPPSFQKSTIVLPRIITHCLEDSCQVSGSHPGGFCSSFYKIHILSPNPRAFRSSLLSFSDNLCGFFPSSLGVQRTWPQWPGFVQEGGAPGRRKHFLAPLNGPGTFRIPAYRSPPSFCRETPYPCETIERSRAGPRVP